jgi:hypothetical protein
MRHPRIPRYRLPAAAAAGLLVCLSATAARPQAATDAWQFLAPPHAELNRIYRVERATGRVIACQYQAEENAIGRTQCFPAGEGAEGERGGDFALVASGHRGEAGIFRVNRRTGEVAICYVLNEEKVVCTPVAP